VKRIFRGPWLWIALAVVGVLIALQYLAPNGGYDEVQTSQMEEFITSGDVKTITFKDNDQEIQATLDDDVDRDNKKVVTHWVSGQQNDLIRKAQEQVDAGKIEKYNSENPQPSLIGSLLVSLIPFIIILGLFIFLMNQMQGGGGRVMQFAKSRAKLISKDMPKTTFADVAGCDEAIEELGEIKEFLQEPAKFQAVGAKIPKGVLLYGPPGTGKTLLARAVAGEAGVPFYSISGSDFVEMFVGVGASRVRDLFEQAKENAPAIVFIDEIDAVGRHRGAGLGGGHDEREQTLNQLLVEMDGFESNEGVILVAATNRPDVLDPALLRPGRFDRRIVVNRPDVKGREGILSVHTKKIPMADDVDVAILARGTSGFSGADLANLVNEAALNAARYNQKVVRMHDFEYAKDKVLMGAERRSMIISEEEKKVTAIHEAGHALLTVKLPHADPIQKVTISPRGKSLGLTQTLPMDEKHNYSREYLEDQIAILLGGRIAEEITMGSITTGAGNDLERATDLARRMVCEWGMSGAMGPLTFGKKEEQIFLGREIAQHTDYSEDTALRIDQEVKRFVTDNYNKALAILTEHKAPLMAMADALLQRETLDAEQVIRLANGQTLDEPAPITPPSGHDTPAREANWKERNPLVPTLPPRPVTQE
jgi:cell division protease FtsH